ncbi:hypothetical protein HDU96_001131, partial [Phlyctochytrium bullatum]
MPAGPLSAAMRLTARLDDDVLDFDLAPPPVDHPWRLLVEVEVADDLPSFPTVFPRSRDQHVRYWTALSNLSHSESALLRQVWPFAILRSDEQTRSLSFEPFFPKEIHQLVIPGRFTAAARAAGFLDDPAPRPVIRSLGPATVLAHEAAEEAPTVVARDPSAFVSDAPVNIPLPGSFQFPDSPTPLALHDERPHDESTPAQDAFAADVVFGPLNPDLASAADEPHSDSQAPAPAWPITPERPAPPLPIPLRTTRSRVRLATPLVSSPISPLRGYYRPPLGVATPYTSGGASFYTPAAPNSPSMAPQLTPPPVPFGGWTQSWVPTKPDPHSVASPSPPVPSPLPRRPPTTAVLPDAWHPPVLPAISDRDAKLYAERLAALDAQVASLKLLEQRLFSLAETFTAASTAAAALTASAAPPAPPSAPAASPSSSGGSSSSSSSSSHHRPPSRGPAPPRRSTPSPHASPASAYTSSTVPASLIKQAADEVAKIRFDGTTGIGAFRWFARLRAALLGRVISYTNPGGLFSTIDEAYLRLRTRQWFPNGADYDPKWMVVESDIFSWDLFEDFCRTAFFRAVSEEDLQRDLTQYQWSRAKEPFSLVWAHLLGLNSYLSSGYRLHESDLRKLWCESCDSPAWKKAVRQLTVPGYDGLPFHDPFIPMKAVFDAIDSHIGMATGTAETVGASAVDLTAIQKQVDALTRQLQNPSSRPNTRRERLNIVAFANSTAAVDRRGLPLTLPPKGAAPETRDRYVSKVMSIASDFLVHYPDVERLEDEDADDLYLLMDDPTAIPEPLAGGELFYTVDDTRSKYAPGFPSAVRDRRNVAFKDKPGSSAPRGSSPHPRPPTPGSSASPSGMVAIATTTDASQSDLIPVSVTSSLSTISAPSVMPFPEVLLFSMLRAFFPDSSHCGPVIENKGFFSFSHLPHVKVLSGDAFANGTLPAFDRFTLPRTVVFLPPAGVLEFLQAIQRRGYSCLALSPPLSLVSADALALLQRFSCTPPILVRSTGPWWGSLLPLPSSHVLWRLDGSLASSPVDWSTLDPSLPPLSIVPSGTLRPPAAAPLHLFSVRPTLATSLTPPPSSLPGVATVATEGRKEEVPDPSNTCSTHRMKSCSTQTHIGTFATTLSVTNVQREDAVISTKSRPPPNMVDGGCQTNLSFPAFEKDPPSPVSVAPSVRTDPFTYGNVGFNTTSVGEPLQACTSLASTLSVYAVPSTLPAVAVDTGTYSVIIDTVTYDQATQTDPVIITALPKTLIPHDYHCVALICARINDQLHAEVLLDTGADINVITRAALRRIKSRYGRGVQVHHFPHERQTEGVGGLTTLDGYCVLEIAPGRQSRAV